MLLTNATPINLILKKEIKCKTFLDIYTIYTNTSEIKIADVDKGLRAYILSVSIWLLYKHLLSNITLPLPNAHASTILFF